MRKRGKTFKRINTFGGVALLAKHQQAQRLSRPLTDAETAHLLIPARVSAAQLMDGVAEIGDLHNVTAFLNVGMVLSNDIGEGRACKAVQAGILRILEVKQRPGPTYAMNAAQREDICLAVQLTDELFSVSTLLEISVAHRKVLAALDRKGEAGNLEPVEIAA